MLTAKQQELINLLLAALPTTPAEAAQQNVDWYKQWKYAETVNIGDRRWSMVDDEKVLFEVYNSAGDNLYPPEQIPAVWKRVYLEEWPEWKDPTGAHDSYNTGDKVTYQGKKYISKIDGNVTIPGIDSRWWEEYVG